MAAKNMPQKQEDYITNKVLAVFTVCLGGVLILMGLKKLIDFGTTFTLGMMVVRILMGVSAVGVLVGIWQLMRERKNNIDNTYRIATGRHIITVFLAALIILAFVHHYTFPIFKVFYGLLPALAVYYLIYHSYQPEFCVISVDCGVTAALLLIVRRAQISANVKYLAWVAAAISVVIVVVQLAAVAKVKAKHGKIMLGKRKRDFMFSQNAYKMMNITPIVMAVFVVAGAVLGTTAALYILFAALAYLFVTAVYYTVKMM